MNDNIPASSEYIHGSSPEEQHRLSLLNEILNESCLKAINLTPDDKVLDVGCGLGQFTRQIAHAVGGKGQVVGIERDQDQLSQAKSLAKAAGEPELVEFRQGDALTLPLSDLEWGTFDIALARFLLEHVPSPSSVIAQMVQSVRPGGRVIVSDDDHGDFRPWPEPIGFKALWTAYVQMYERLGNDPYVGRRLVWLLQDAGLTSLRNNSVFFGGCAGDEKFLAIADNLIGALTGAKDAILSGELLDQKTFDIGIGGLRKWKTDPSAALWYSMCSAEGTVPN